MIAQLISPCWRAVLPSTPQGNEPSRGREPIRVCLSPHHGVVARCSRLVARGWQQQQ